LIPRNHHRTFASGVFVDVLVSKVLGKAVVCRDLYGFTGIHSSDEITEILEIRTFDSPHVLIDVVILIRIPPKLLLDNRIGIVYEHRSLGIVMGSPIS